MIAEAKAALGTANTGSGMGDQTIRQAVDLPKTNFTTAVPLAQGLSAYLTRGSKNRVSAREFMRLLRLKYVWSLCVLVSRERAKGALFLSSGDGGHYLPDEGKAGRRIMLRFVAKIRAKGFHTLEAARPEVSELRKIDGQQVMDLSAALDAEGLHELDTDGESNLPGTEVERCGET